MSPFAFHGEMYLNVPPLNLFFNKNERKTTNWRSNGLEHKKRIKREEGRPCGRPLYSILRQEQWEQAPRRTQDVEL